MIASGPFTLTLNIPVSVQNPLAMGGVPPSNIQIQNSSGYVLTVTTGALEYTLQPFVAQTVPLTPDGTNVTVEATQNPYNIAVNTFTAVWLLSGESPPMNDGPLTSAAIIAAVQSLFGAGIPTTPLYAPPVGSSIVVSSSFTNTSFAFTDQTGNPVPAGTPLRAVGLSCTGVTNQTEIQLNLGTTPAGTFQTLVDLNTGPDALFVPLPDLSFFAGPGGTNFLSGSLYALNSTATSIRFTIAAVKVLTP